MIRAVLFDAFGTLFRPRLPIHQQYAQVAESYGLLVSPDEVRTGFRKAFKEMSAAHPLYGKFSNPPMHYEEWWTNLIEKTFQYTDVADSDLQTTLPTLLPALMDRFSSNQGYVLHDDTLPCLEGLQARDLPIGIISNSDPRTLGVLSSLKLVPNFIAQERITLSWHVGKPKPSPEIFCAACENLGFESSEVVMVGDDLDEDYKGAIAAGLQAVFLQRTRHDADWVRRENAQEELTGVEIVTSLADLPDWIDMHNNSNSTR